jgi:hypothetical protein
MGPSPDLDQVSGWKNSTGLLKISSEEGQIRELAIHCRDHPTSFFDS